VAKLNECKIDFDIFDVLGLNPIGSQVKQAQVRARLLSMIVHKGKEEGGQ
jgi:hypothetical protein